ncbi:MAG: bifunctional (p)ppGpp synthetase/guanosine-3',5'-bis(diphosphate) 3'-pyrophosphohydrolase [Burkholderiales bacterium]|nr:bifunctional (p)ppGpp synthetase/guanosine-3',5'-bis(diphosphate) 3'-pyrophosphohydrolase [Burkholderiales bacterium]
MVTVTLPRENIDSWLDSLAPAYAPEEIAFIGRALERLSAADSPDLERAIGTASILAEMHLDDEVVAASLLLFAGEIGEDFGEEVAGLVEGVRRFSMIEIEKIEKGELEGLRKMLLAIVQDVRVLLIKLADQLQLLRSLVGSDRKEERLRVAIETRDIYSPLANRLGIWQIKWELEDLSFRVLEPETYRKIAKLLDEKRIGRQEFISSAISELRAALDSAGIHGDISGRPKHIYSIYKKMQRKNLDFEEIYDVRAVRVLVDSVKDCYAVLGLVHDMWTPIPGEFDDYIARPKENGYSSLHTGVIGPQGKALEVQIRTFEMHNTSEMGVAAHWRYKEGGRRDAAFEEKVALLRKLLGWQEEPSGLAKQIREGLSRDSVYVLTPQGRVIDLPGGSTPVDFAYHVHTELGHRCRGAKVDGAIVPLNYVLKTGERVEIISAKQGGPSLDWLSPEFARSSRARAKIRQWFNSRNFEASVAQGRQILERELKRAGKSGESLDRIAALFHFQKQEEFLAELGRGGITPRQIQSCFREEEPEREPVLRPKSHHRPGEVLVVGVDRLLTQLAGCCKPVPPDPIVGFVSRGRGIMIHRRSCPNVARMEQTRLLDAQWGGGEGRYAVDIVIEASDRQGLLRDIFEVLSREKVNVTATRTISKKDRASMHLTLEVEDSAQLRRMLALISEVPDVVHAGRR